MDIFNAICLTANAVNSFLPSLPCTFIQFVVTIVCSRRTWVTNAINGIKTMEPDFNTAHLPPSLSGNGNNRAVDNVFFAPRNNDSTGEVYPEDSASIGSQIDDAHALDIDDGENCNVESALGIADATDDQIIEVFFHLASKIGVNKGRTPIDRLLDIMTRLCWTERDLARKLRDSKRSESQSCPKITGERFYLCAAGR